MSYVFTCRAQWPLDSNRSNFLGCCMVTRWVTWRWRLRFLWRVQEVEQDAQVELEVQVMVWSTMLVRMMMVRRQRRRVHDRGETSSQSPIG
jgi:hypothetical protein